jgi:hypothetical protein
VEESSVKWWTVLGRIIGGGGLCVDKSARGGSLDEVGCVGNVCAVAGHEWGKVAMVGSKKNRIMCAAGQGGSD